MTYLPDMRWAQSAAQPPRPVRAAPRARVYLRARLECARITHSALGGLAPLCQSGNFPPSSSHPVLVVSGAHAGICALAPKTAMFPTARSATACTLAPRHAVLASVQNRPRWMLVREGHGLEIDVSSDRQMAVGSPPLLAAQPCCCGAAPWHSGNGIRCRAVACCEVRRALDADREEWDIIDGMSAHRRQWQRQRQRL